MTDEQILFLLLAALHVAESCLWAPRGTAVIARRGGQWRLARPRAWLRHDGGGVVVRQLLPPLGTAFCCPRWPLSMSPSGVLSFVSVWGDTEERGEQEGRFFRLEDLGEVRVEGIGERRVAGTGGRLLRAASSREAWRVAATVAALAKAAPAARTGVIDTFLAAHFDGERAARRYEEWRAASRPVRLVGNILFLHLFVVAPLAVAWIGIEAALWPVGSLLFGLVAANALLFFRAHRRLYPDEAAERVESVLTMFLLPPRAVRGHDVLARGLFDGFHPLVAARASCTPEVFAGLAREVARDAATPALPLCPSEAAGAAETEEFFRRRFVGALHAFLARAGVAAAALAAPAGERDDAPYRCPRCLDGFVDAAARCDRCGGLRPTYVSMMASIQRASSGDADRRTR